MGEYDDWNTKIIAEFRANEGKVSGQFEGAPMLLLHNKGRKSGRELVTPMMYLQDEDDASKLYIFASKAGAPSNPDWYYNITTSGNAEIEVGTDEVPVTVSEVKGEDRDRIYAKQASLYPGFAGYEEKTAGIRTIPVVALHRS